MGDAFISNYAVTLYETFDTVYETFDTAYLLFFDGVSTEV